jgi:hypothetical protein
MQKTQSTGHAYYSTAESIITNQRGTSSRNHPIPATMVTVEKDEPTLSVNIFNHVDAIS